MKKFYISDRFQLVAVKKSLNSFKCNQARNSLQKYIWKQLKFTLFPDLSWALKRDLKLLFQFQWLERINKNAFGMCVQGLQVYIQNIVGR